MAAAAAAAGFVPPIVAEVEQPTEAAGVEVQVVTVATVEVVPVELVTTELRGGGGLRCSVLCRVRRGRAALREKSAAVLSILFDTAPEEVFRLVVKFLS